MNLTTSATGPACERGAPVVLRLLPHVHHPPARVLLPWGGDEARALDARGYRVTTHGVGAPGISVATGPFLEGATGEFDLVCENGGFAALPPEARGRYVEAAARALRPGGLLFGAFPGEDAGALLSLFGPRFDAARLEPSAFGEASGWLEAVFVRR